MNAWQTFIVKAKETHECLHLSDSVTELFNPLNTKLFSLTLLKLCLADAIHNLNKRVKNSQIWQNVNCFQI